MMSFLMDYSATITRPLAELISSGGPVVVLLLVLSIIALALIVAKLIQFSMLGVGRRASARRAMTLWLEGRRPEALRLSLQGKSSLNGVLQKLMTAKSRPDTSDSLLREDIERVCQSHIATLRSYLRPLDMISQTAPLIGLLGTVLGMIEAFQAMQGSGAAVDPSVLAGGIWVALLTTAVGLSIAIPVSAVVGWFDGRIEAEEQALESLVTTFFTGGVAERAPANPASTANIAEAQINGPIYAV